jgi:hypothetical protein
VKQALCSVPVLALPDWTLSFVLTTDWSRLAIGAVLSQENSEGEEHSLAFALCSLTAAEQNYAATEGECLAVEWSDKFHYCLHGKRFLLRTDHKALEWLVSARFLNSKLERWAMQLQAYDASVQGMEGNSGGHRSHACTVVLYTKRLEMINMVLSVFHAEFRSVTAAGRPLDPAAVPR